MITLYGINWLAIDHVRDYYMQQHNSWNTKHYQEWLLETWGVNHGTTSIEVVDESKYMLFLLRFA